jgi:hypothetical protein
MPIVCKPDLAATLADSSLRTILVSGHHGSGKTSACVTAFADAGFHVVLWDPVDTGMRVPAMIGDHFVADGRRATVIFVDDIDVAVKAVKGGGAALLAALGAFKSRGGTSRVVMTCGPVTGDRVLAALARAVDTHVSVSPPTSGHGSLEQAFGADMRGLLLAMDNLSTHGATATPDDLDGMDDCDFCDYARGARAQDSRARKGCAATVPSSVTTHLALDAALFAWAGRDAIDGRLSSVACELSAMVVRQT